MDFKEEIAVLWAERQKAIDIFEFAKAKNIESQIAELKEKQNNNGSHKKNFRANMSFEQEKEMLKKRAIELSSITSQNIYKIRTKYQTRIAELHKKHSDELSELETEISKGMELELIRPVPETELLLYQSKLVGKTSDFELADELYKKANDIELSIKQKRQEDLHHKFVGIQEELLRKQAKEVQEHHKKLEYEISEEHRNYQKIITKLKTAYKTNALRCKVAITETEVEEFFAPYFVCDDVHTETKPREDLPKRSPASSPKKPRVLTHPAVRKSPVAKSPHKSQRE